MTTPSREVEDALVRSLRDILPTDGVIDPNGAVTPADAYFAYRLLLRRNPDPVAELPGLVACRLPFRDFLGSIVNSHLHDNYIGAYTFGAFTVGVLANLYSRVRHGVAAAVLLPAVYVQVPGSLASSGAITSGLAIASNIT